MKELKMDSQKHQMYQRFFEFCRLGRQCVNLARIATRHRPNSSMIRQTRLSVLEHAIMCRQRKLLTQMSQAQGAVA